MVKAFLATTAWVVAERGYLKEHSTEHARGLSFEVSLLEINDYNIIFLETSKIRPLPINIIDITLRE